MKLRLISRSEILSLITMGDAIESMAQAFGQLSAGNAEMPVRGQLASSDGLSLFMPARIQRSGGGESGGQRGAKVVSVFPGNRGRNLPVINGVVMMIDDETGTLAAVMEAGELTAVRTAAAAGLAAKLLSRADSRVLTIFGAGAQAPRQIEAMREVRPIEEVRVVSAGGESAANLVSTLVGVEARAFTDKEEAVRGADIVVSVTPSRSPVFDGRAISPETHVSGSGSFTPEMQEIDPEVVERARVVVEEREAAMEEAGDLLVPIGEGRLPADVIDCELGEIVNGTAPSGRAGHELTFFKSVGVAVQDVAIGALVLARAEAEDVGQVVDLG